MGCWRSVGWQFFAVLLTLRRRFFQLTRKAKVPLGTFINVSRWQTRLSVVIEKLDRVADKLDASTWLKLAMLLTLIGYGMYGILVGMYYWSDETRNEVRAIPLCLRSFLLVCFLILTICAVVLGREYKQLQLMEAYAAWLAEVDAMGEIHVVRGGAAHQLQRLWCAACGRHHHDAAAIPHQWRSKASVSSFLRNTKLGFGDRTHQRRIHPARHRGGGA